MKVFKTQEEFDEALDDNGDFTFKGDVTFSFNLEAPGNIRVGGNIKAGNIIGVDGLVAFDVDAMKIKVNSINVRDIKAINIEVSDLIARNVSYYTCCIIWNSRKYNTMKGRKRRKYPNNKEVEIKDQDNQRLATKSF